MLSIKIIKKKKVKSMEKSAAKGFSVIVRHEQSNAVYHYKL